MKIPTREERILIERIAIAYVRDPYSTFETLGYRFDIPAKRVSRLLYTGIAADILPNNVSDYIFNKVVYSYKKGQINRRNHWEEAFDMREKIRADKRNAKKSN